MSKQTVDLVKNLYAAFIDGDIAMIANSMSDTGIWRVIGRRQDNPLFGDRCGPEGVADFFRILDDIQEAAEFSPREYYDIGNKVFVIGHYAWTYRKSGKTAASEFAHVFTIEGGVVRKFVEFTDTALFAEAFRMDAQMDAHVPSHAY